MQKKIYKLYKQLLNEHGPQNWWPADSNFEVIIGTILTQNTNWNNVEKAISNLKKENITTPEKILKTNHEKLKKLIRPAGFFNQKVARLKRIAKWYKSYNKKEYKNMKEIRKGLLNIKGIGPETADSIILYALNEPSFVIDTYTKRFCKHHKILPKKDNYDSYKKLFETNLDKNVRLYNEYHALIVQWGKNNKK